MRRTVYRVVASLAVLSGAAACTQEAEDLVQPKFFIKANKNGVAWIMPAPSDANYVTNFGAFNVSGKQSDEDNTDSSLQLIFFVPVSKSLAPVLQIPATVTVPAYQAMWSVRTDGGVLIDSYTQDSPPTSHLLITRLDTVQKIVEGTFEATVKRDARWSTQGETIRFTEGSFRVRYKQIVADWCATPL